MSDRQIRFVTLGEAVLDHLQFGSEKAFNGVLGGSGTYCALGARLHLSSPQSQSLGWKIEGGDDFPHAVELELRSWDMTLLFSKITTLKTTRARLVYGDTPFGSKTFEYLSYNPPIRPIQLINTPLISSLSYHFLSSPLEAESICLQILEYRQAAGITVRPWLFWEPEGSLCSPDTLDAHIKVCRLVDVFSPNRFELAAFFGNDIHSPPQESAIMEWCTFFLEHGIGPSFTGTIIVRADVQGCFVMSHNQPFRRLPAYYEPQLENESTPMPSSQEKVIDPTGAGNAFMGGFAIGFVETGDIIKAISYGAVSSSFALEQIGIPRRAVAEDGSEWWNGDCVRSRLDLYLSSIRKDIVDA